ncbi:hypothetical protein BESB_010540 [Besnoitia besnoiti]|uniref:Uncharacterized protein n=1 Tax=Besnoitia besnoiti TaxID=94643 RepID=A0A2A9MR20_BESBE|nr:hypothetical protein BESB_010540 [Besnoitia besnoiti]PFH38712.1 hypothetical protein BESB_010540 [Besnoitia besnoiti]
MASSDSLFFLLNNVWVAPTAVFSSRANSASLAVYLPATVSQAHSGCQIAAGGYAIDVARPGGDSVSPHGKFLLINVNSSDDLGDKLDELVLHSFRNWGQSSTKLKAVKIHVLRSLLSDFNFHRPPLLPLLLQPNWGLPHTLRAAAWRKYQPWHHCPRRKPTAGLQQQAPHFDSSTEPPLEAVFLSIFSWQPLFSSLVDVGAAHALGIRPTVLEAASRAFLAAALTRRENALHINRSSISSYSQARQHYGHFCLEAAADALALAGTVNLSSGRRDARPSRARGQDESSSLLHDGGCAEGPRLSASVHSIVAAALLARSCDRSLATVCPRVTLMRAISYWWCLEQLQLPDPWSSSGSGGGGPRHRAPSRGENGWVPVVLNHRSEAPSPFTPLGGDSCSPTQVSPGSLLTSPSGSLSLARGGGGPGTVSTNDSMRITPGASAAVASSGASGASDGRTATCGDLYLVRGKNIPSSGNRLLQQLQDSFDSSMAAVLERQHESLIQLRERQSTEMEEACGRREERGVEHSGGEGPRSARHDERLGAESVAAQDEIKSALRSESLMPPHSAEASETNSTVKSGGGGSPAEDVAGMRGSQGTLGRTNAGLQKGSGSLDAAEERPIVSPSCEVAKTVEALVLQHVSEFELLELHWRAERVLLRQQHLQDLKDVAVDLYLLHKAAVDGQDSPLILPPLPSAHESDLLPADWHSRNYGGSVSQEALLGLHQRQGTVDVVGGTHTRGRTSSNRLSAEETSVEVCNPHWHEDRAGEGRRTMSRSPLFPASPISAGGGGRATRGPVDEVSSGEMEASSNSFGTRGLPSTERNAVSFGASQHQPLALPPALHIVTPTSVLRRLIEHRRKQQEERAKEGGNQAVKDWRQGTLSGVVGSSSAPRDARLPVSRRSSCGEVTAGSASSSERPRARSSRSSLVAVEGGASPPSSATRRGDQVRTPPSARAAREPPSFPAVVDVRPLLSPSVWEQRLRCWPEEQMLRRLKQHAILPLMFGQQRKRCFVIRICTGNVTDIAQHASSASAGGAQLCSASGGVEATTLRTPEGRFGQFRTGDARLACHESSSTFSDSYVDYLCGMSAAYDYHATEYPSRADFFWIDSVASPFTGRSYCSDDALMGGAPPPGAGGACYRRGSLASIVTARGTQLGISRSGEEEADLGRSVSADASALLGFSNSSSSLGRAPSCDPFSHTVCIKAADHARCRGCSGGIGNCWCSSSFSLVGPRPQPLVAIVLPVATSLKLRAPAYQRWRAQTAAASDFVFPGIDEQRRMLDVHLRRRAVAQNQGLAEGPGSVGGTGHVTAVSGEPGTFPSAAPSALEVGEVFISRHSNNGGASVIFHLVVSGAAPASRKAMPVSAVGKLATAVRGSELCQRDAVVTSVTDRDYLRRMRSTNSGGNDDTSAGKPRFDGDDTKEPESDLCRLGANEDSGTPASGDPSFRNPPPSLEKAVHKPQQDSALLLGTCKLEPEGLLPSELQRGLKEVLSVASTGGIRTLTMPLLLTDGGAADCSLPFALLQRRVFQVLRCLINELRCIASSSERSPQLRQIVLVLPQQQSQRHEAGKGAAKGGGEVSAGDVDGERKTQDERWMNGILQSTINFIRHSTHCCTLVR